VILTAREGIAIGVELAAIAIIVLTVIGAVASAD